MSEQRLASSGDSFVDLTEMQIVDLLNKLSDENTRLHKKLNEQQATIEQLRTQLTICQQSKNDDGRIKVWQVPPIPKGMRITTSTSSGEKDE